MDVLRPGHSHRSSSDRLLNNYLDSQRSLSGSLLTLLSHSHTSTSSLLAYVTSSPGVLQPVRRSVRHAGFEGPLAKTLLENHSGSQTGSVNGVDHDSPGWAAYVSSLEQFRKDLKQIHLLEEELSRVKRDREILVTRLIKTTKARPTKSDLSALANSYVARPEGSVISSRASIHSVTSNGSSTSKDGKRATKLQEAQAELLGCEEHLRSLEVRIEHERNKVMMRGLEERFRAMDAVGRMWVSQAKRGLSDLEKAHELPADAFELDSNPSIAPSQSASQIAFDDLPSHRGNFPYPKFGSRRGPGSITGSIAEEDETSSGDEASPGQQLVMHENRGGARPSPNRAKSPTSTIPARPSPLGVPSVNTRSRPLSTTFGGPGHNDDSDSELPAYGGGGRRAASEVGAMGYHPPTGRQPLRRTFSAEQQTNGGPSPQRAESDSSSIRNRPKKQGFFASLSKMFKGGRRREGSIRSGRDSPPYGSSTKGPWHTRTDTNLKRQTTLTGGKARRGDDSSSDGEAGTLVSVSNQRNNSFSVADVGRPSGIRRSSSTPVASGLIPPRPTRADLGANRAGGSQSTLIQKKSAVGRATSPTPSAAARATSPTPSAIRATSPTPSRSKTPTARGSLSRSNTVKSTMSAKSAGNAKSTGTAKKATRQNESVARAAVGSQQAVEGRNIMSLVDIKAPPVMPEVPKAPKSQVTPQMELAKAPGSSLVLPTQGFSTSAGAPNKANGDSTPQIDRPMSRAGSVKQVPQANASKSNTPLPPSRSLQAPLKSALRPTSPSPSSPPASTSIPSLSPPIEFPRTLYSVSAPGPVQLPREAPTIPTPAPPAPKANSTRRNSYHSTASATDRESIYESAVEDEGGRAAEDEESSSDEEDHSTGYEVVENEKIAQSGVVVGPPAVEKIPVRRNFDADEASILSEATATGNHRAPSDAGSRRRPKSVKSVRMAVPDSPSVEMAHAPPPLADGAPSVDRPPSPEPEKRQEEWSTRIGKEDMSDVEDRDEDYAKARKGLAKNTGKWETVPGEKAKRASLKSRFSAKGGMKGTKA